MEENKLSLYIKLMLAGSCYGIVRNYIYHKKTLYRYYDFNERKYIDQKHTLTTQISKCLLNIMLCQPLTLPLIILDDINIIEKTYRKYKMDERLDILPFFDYVWKK